MSQRMKAAMAVARTCSGLAVLAWAVACSSGNEYATEVQPKLQVTLDQGKTALVAPSCNNFEKDQTGGQLSSLKKLIVKNAGSTATTAEIRPLCVKYTVKDTNSQIKVTAKAGANKPDTAKCPNANYALQPNSSILFEIEYRGNETGDSDPVEISIETNDPVLKSAKYCFGIDELGATPELVPTEHTFINATAANPPTQCFQVRNKGGESVTFLGASLEPANAQYTLTKQPTTADYVAGKGTAENPEGTKYLEVCVRYTPDNTPGNEQTQLVIQTSGKPSELRAQLDATTQAEATFSIDCSEPTGKQVFSFPLASSKTAKCKIFNFGPPVLKVQNVKAMALQAKDEDAVAAAFKAQIVDISGAPQTVYAIGKDKSVDIVLNFTAGAAVPPAAVVSVGYASAGSNGRTLYIPISVGGCDTAQADFGPSPLWASAAVGSEAKQVFAIANQSCAGLTVVNVCTVDGSYPGKDPCSAPSKHFSLAKGFATTTLAPFSINTLDVVFKPADDKKKQITDRLNISYCAGTFAGGKCSGELVSRDISLIGVLDIAGAKKAPVGQLAVAGDAAALQAGKPVVLEMSVKDPGDFAGQTFFYNWIVAKRPEGSTTWLPEGYQSTDQEAKLSLVPDLKGEYTVIGAVQGIDNDTSASAYSAQVSLTFTVK